MKKSIVFILVLSAILTGCSRRDAKLTKAVIGDWTSGIRETVWKPDGSFTASYHYARGTVTFTGTWQIKDGVLISTITNAVGPEPHVAVGTVGRAKITAVDAHTLVYEAKGQTNILSR